MTTLYGDKIESLLWSNGFEFKHLQYIHLNPEIEIFADTFSIILGETWTDEDDWYLDADSIYYELVQGGETFDMGYLEGVEDEHSLMGRIVEFGEQ